MSDYVDKNIHSTFNSRKNTGSKELMEEEEEELQTKLMSNQKAMTKNDKNLIITTQQTQQSQESQVSGKKSIAVNDFSAITNQGREKHPAIN